MSFQVSRREFVKRGSLFAQAAIIAPSLSGLVAACADPGNGADGLGGSETARQGADYGPLQVYPDLPEISLPRGFHARLLSKAGDLMSDGNVTPNAMDGTGAFAMGGNRVRLVRNHEIRNDYSDPNRRTLGEVNLYDRFGPAGNTTLEIELRPDGEAELKRHFVSLAGTFVNCAGGVTPWGSWISCEETVAGTNAGWEKNHGYNFENPARSNGPVVPVPLRAMGRFVHEAVCVDPETGIVYQTEDRNPAGFYRFVPTVRDRLASGGRLEMLAVRGTPRYDTRKGQTIGARRECEWVPIERPDSDEPSISAGFVFDQGLANGGAQFARLEGCWYGDGGAYFNSTSGGDAEAGQVWKFTPSGDGGELTLIFESPSREVLDAPDNLCVSPRGGLVICEDGSGTNYVRGLSRAGRVFDLVRNNENDSEWVGACFAPQGRTLFVSIQGSTNSASTRLGKTFAIWGPWESGAL
jgi:secreted PhoX family phosphatase